MDTIEQLKAMRDAARERIEALPDYKLMTKLTALIGELEEVFGVREAGEGEASGEGETAEEESESEAEARGAQAAGERSDATGPDEARYAVEETAVVDPEEEVSEKTFGSEDDSSDAKAVSQGVSLDTDEAIRQAMAELEADLSASDGETEPASRNYRYGNPS